ncbi:MAG: Histidine kinase, partial [Candidatus Poribacteria bacterium]|nr:Histidine kinase [Candidatus Poribacteria bacterium]
MIWTLRKKIFIGFSIVLVLLVVVFVWAFVYLLMLGQASNAILKDNYNSILAADNMVGAIERQDSAILLVILSYEKDGVKQFHDNERIFLQWLARARDNITEEGESLAVDTIDTEYSAYLVDFSNLRQLHNVDPKKTALFYHETVLPTFNLVRDKCLRLREINQNAMFGTSDRARHISENSVMSMTVIGIVTIIIGIAFSLYLSNRLVRPIKQITEAMRKVSENDYDSKVSISSDDELGALADQYNDMIERLEAYHDLNIGQIISEKQKNEAIIRNIDDGVIVIDTEYKIANINPTAVEIRGIELNVMQGKHFLEVVKNEQLFNYVKQSMESGQPPTIEVGLNTITIKHRDITQYYMFSITPVHQ